MIQMLEFICAIPESIGWALVGFVACLCVMMIAKLGKLFIQMWRERKAEDEFWAVRHGDDCED